MRDLRDNHRENHGQPHCDNAGCENPFSLAAIIAAFLRVKARRATPN